jgi:carboxymethylenebutenolidase
VAIDWKHLTGPILLFCGERDKGVPPEACRRTADELKRLGKKAELKIYPDADHAFFNDTRPEVYNKVASTDAWKKTLEFFRANVK